MGIKIFLILVILSTGADSSLKGKRFVVGFIENYYSEWFPEITFYFLSETDTNVTITSKGFGISDQVSVNAFIQMRYSTNRTYFYQSDLRVTDMSFYIESIEVISVIAFNFVMPYGDGFMALPFDALGTRYLLVSHNVDHVETDMFMTLIYNGRLKSAFLVIATEDLTTVNITLKIEGPNEYKGCSWGTFQNGEQRSFVLNSYQILGSYCGDDITGTLIVSDKPIAVIVGHNFRRMIADTSSDHNLEMLLPVEHYGLNYVLSVPPVPRQEAGALYRVVGSQADTNLRTSDGITAVIGEGTYFDMVVNTTNGPTFLQADKPVTVVQFTISKFAMTLVPAVSQFTSSYDVVRLVTLDNPEYDIEEYFLTIVIPTDEVIGLRPTSLVPQFEVVSGTCFSTGYINMASTEKIQQLHHTGGVNFGLIINTYIKLAFGYYSFVGGLHLNGHAAKTECLENSCSDGMPFPCSCAEGFFSYTCNDTSAACDADPCVYSSNCTDLVTSYICTCVKGAGGAHCEHDIFDHCNTSGCLNGKCEDKISTYMCHCDPGYEGKTCELDINECEAQPCENNGNCSHGIAYYNCSCPPGFLGDNCEIDYDECSSNPCVNGTCNDFANMYNCTCTDGYEGENCDTDIDYCLNNTCVNGTCNDFVNMYNCTCTPGFEGENCDTDVDECATSPCENGECTQGFNTYTCTCTPGYEGTDCDLNIDECGSAPCRNNGNCTDMVDGYECVCPGGINGTNCEFGGDPCVINPCRNNGTCESHETEFTCACAAGFEGDTCDTDIDDCASSPCQNDGTCRDGINAFECLCPDNVSGLLCEFLVSCGCPCIHNMTDAELAAKLAWLRSVLLLDRSNLSATIRKKISVVDDRPSSNSIGFSGLVCLIGAFGFFILMDGINILRFFTTKPSSVPPKVYALKQ